MIESNMQSLKSLDEKLESYGSLLISVLMNKLSSELRLVASQKFIENDSWDFSALLRVIEEEVQAQEQFSTHILKVRYIGNNQLVLCCSPVLPHLNDASVSKDTHHKIVELLQELSLIRRVSERVAGAMFVLGRVMCHIVVIAE